MGKTWDTEKIEKFIDSFSRAYDRYTDDLHSLEDGMSKYYFNDTYRGQAAVASKNFIEDGQSKLHVKQIEIQRRLVIKYYEMLEAFKNKVDSSSIARIDTDLLQDIKKSFKIYDNVIDVEGYDIESKARYIADKFGRINGNLIPPSYRMVSEMYEDFCGSGGLFDQFIRKVEEFDEEMCRDIGQSGIEEDVDELHSKIVSTVAALDSMQVSVENMPKFSLGLSSLSAKALSAEEQKELRKKAKEIYISKLFEKINGSRFSATYEDTFKVDDSKRARIGKVSDTFVTVIDSNSSSPYYGGNQSWFSNEPDYGERLDANGCGAIAAVNLSLYLTGQTKVTKEEYEKMVNDYMKAVDCSPESRGKKSAHRIKAIKGFTGALPGQMTEYVTNTCRDKGINVKTNWDYVQGYEDDYRNMKKQLNDGIPVIWAVNDNNENAKKTNDESRVGVMFYKYDALTGTYSVYDKAVTSHYVTVTAIYEDTDTTGKAKRMVEVSSWGNKLYVDYDQYVDLVSDDPNNEPFSSITNTTVGK